MGSIRQATLPIQFPRLLVRSSLQGWLLELNTCITCVVTCAFGCESLSCI